MHRVGARVCAVSCGGTCVSHAVRTAAKRMVTQWCPVTACRQLTTSRASAAAAAAAARRMRC